MRHTMPRSSPHLPRPSTAFWTCSTTRGVTLPTGPDAKHKAMAAKLEKMSGDAFDKAYMKGAGVQDHKTVHAKLVAASKKAKDPELKALVDKTEAVVAQHLKSAEQMPMAKSGTTSGK